MTAYDFTVRNGPVLADLISEHGECYDRDGYHGCDCGYACSVDEWPHHLAGVLLSALGGAA